MSGKVSSATCLRGGFLAAILGFGLLGCGGSDAPEVYHVSGTVTFDGKPVPAGRIRFVPDTSKGNSGPPGYAQIVDGKFDTESEGGQGHVSGPMIVSIQGHDPATQGEASPDDLDAEPSGGGALFPTYQTPVELPKETTTQDFKIPAEAGKVKIEDGPA